MEKALEKKSLGFSPKKRMRKNIAWVCIISFFTLLAYRNIYGSDFFLDDYLHLHLVSRIGNPFTPYFTDLFMGAFFRPGVFVFWKVNYFLFGLNASGYYLSNIIFLMVLITTTFFVFFNITGNRRFSGLATALFALSPITSIGVLWLSNRFDLIGSTFYMVSLLLFLTYLRKDKRSYYIGAIAAGVFSYFCKEMMITLPAVMVICAIFMFQYRSGLKTDVLKKILVLSTPFFTLGVLFILWRYGIIHSLGGYSGEIKEKFSVGYFLELREAFSNYFWLTRSNSILAIYLILFFLLFFRIDFTKINPLFLLGTALVVITFLPLIMIIKIKAVMTFMTPRFFFLPSIGMTILLASVYDPRAPKWRNALAIIFLFGTTLFFTFNTFANVNVWAESRKENVKVMDRVAGFIENQEKENHGDIYYVLISGTDVAFDAGIKMRYPDLINKSYFLNLSGPTQVVGKDDLHGRVGKTLMWPNTFERNPCDYGNLYYGVVEVTPNDIIEKITGSDKVKVISKGARGRLILTDLERVRTLMRTAGVIR